MTQQALGAAVGIKFQQIQKYETGANRVSASRLWDIADALDVPVAYFFEELQTRTSEAPDGIRSPTASVPQSKEVLELVQSYHAIPAAQRHRLLELARVLAEVR